MENKQTCKWEKSFESLTEKVFYITETKKCLGVNHMNPYGRKRDKYFKYCPYCGREIEEYKS